MCHMMTSMTYVRDILLMIKNMSHWKKQTRMTSTYVISCMERECEKCVLVECRENGLSIMDILPLSIGYQGDKVATSS